MAQSISQEAIGATGLPGATAASRHAGATASGAPVSGTFAVGDFIIDQSGNEWVCTVAGTPGTWMALRNATQLQGAAVSATAPTSNQVLTYNSGTSSWTPTTPAAGALTTSTVFLSSNKSLSAGSNTNVTSISLAAGTWLISAQALGYYGGSGYVSIWLGPNSASTTGAYTGTVYKTFGGDEGACYCSTIQTFGTTTTVYMNGYAGTTATVYATDVQGVGVPNVSGIIAIKIA